MWSPARCHEFIYLFISLIIRSHTAHLLIHPLHITNSYSTVLRIAVEQATPLAETAPTDGAARPMDAASAAAAAAAVKEASLMAVKALVESGSTR